jgi:hypothetical protein
VTVLRWITVLWPGLPLTWLRGDGSALCLAIGFSAILNLAIVATWGWVELLTPAMLTATWSVVVLFWLVSLVVATLQMPSILRISRPDAAGDLFGAAQGEYLKGNWFEAESILNQLLARNPSDAEAQLLLVSLLRRIGQHAEACERLRHLATLEGAARWQAEMLQEQMLLERAVAQNVQVVEPSANGLPIAA